MEVSYLWRTGEHFGLELVPRSPRHLGGRGAGGGQVEEVVGHEPLPKVLQAAVAHPRVALQGEALQCPE